jgi:hypothetical protein
MPRKRHNRSACARLDDAEAAGWMNGDWTKAGFIQQVTILLLGALKTAGPRSMFKSLIA